MLLLWIEIAVILQRISNANLSTIDPGVMPIFTDSDCNSVDFMSLQKVQSPPWTFNIQCGATGMIVPVGVGVSINSFVRTHTAMLTGLSRFSSLCDINFWTT